MASKLRKLVHLAGILCTVLVGAELAARLDDWNRLGIPFVANPDRQRDLVTAESWEFHGKPYGQFRKWKLNAFGFRGPSMSREPEPGRPRLMILGASETFGLYESPGKEYPAQLAGLLAGRYEVINAAMAGISLKSMVPYWTNWAGKFKPATVVIYPSPMFYLDLEPPALPKNPLAQSAGCSFQPRMTGRVQDFYRSLPAWLRSWREDWSIWQQNVGKGENWAFRTPPEDRLQLFAADLYELIQSIRHGGAEPILLTHAGSAAYPPGPEDQEFIRAMRMFYPRPTADTLVAFESQANEVIRDLARQHHLQLIDVDRALTGQRDLFADMVHFNDAGAGRMAEVLAKGLER